MHGARTCAVARTLARSHAGVAKEAPVLLREPELDSAITAAAQAMAAYEEETGLSSLPSVRYTLDIRTASPDLQPDSSPTATRYAVNVRTAQFAPSDDKAQSAASSTRSGSTTLHGRAQLAIASQKNEPRNPRAAATTCRGNEGAEGCLESLTTQSGKQLPVSTTVTDKDLADTLDSATSRTTANAVEPTTTSRQLHSLRSFSSSSPSSSPAIKEPRSLELGPSALSQLRATRISRGVYSEGINTGAQTSTSQARSCV